MEIWLIGLIIIYILLGAMYSYGFSNGDALPFLATWLIWPMIFVFVLGYLHAYQFQEILNRDKKN